MILAGDDDVLDRLQAQDAPTQDQFPVEAAPPRAMPAPMEREPVDPGIPALGETVFETGRDMVHELMQPGSGHAIESAFGAGFTRAREVDNMTADGDMLGRNFTPIVEALNKDLPFEQRVPNPWIGSEAQGWARRNGYGALGPVAARDMLEKEVWSRVDDLRRTNPGLAGNLPKDRDDLMQDILAEQRTALAWSEQTAQSKIGAVAGFAGQLVGGMTDTPNILASVLGAPASASLLKSFVIEGGLNMVLDVAGLPSRADRYARIGHPLSGKEIAAELVGDFVLGGLLPTGAKAVTRAMVKDAVPELRTAARIVEDEGQRAVENPHAGDAEGQDLMRQGALTAMQALEDGRPEMIPATQANLDRALDPALEAQRRREGFSIESFDPAKVGTDAANMQYKGGADAEGVTDRLQGVTEWDPVKAGLALVWERADGALVVADGHQRLGLAKRLAAEGQDGVALYGSRFREADGFTAQDMRVIAAYKNIAEGSGSGIDAARLLREAPEGITSLPPRSPLVRQAKDLAALSDDAFGMAINGHVSERDAALVGRWVHDKDLQAPILEHLARESPDTAEEAELIVRQALAAGATREVQNDMFGDFIKADLILPQRVKILKGALSSLRRDKALFATLTEKASTIEAAGNRLNVAENAARGETAARAFATLKALAERKGKISDALQSAAQDAARSGDRRGATARFVKDVRDAISRGDLDSEPSGGAVRDLDVAPEDAGLFAQPQREPALDQSHTLFDDPAEKPDAFVRQSQDLARDIAPAPRDIPPLGHGVGSWMIVDRQTGKAVTELFKDSKAIHSINFEKYEAVPANKYLAELNKTEKKDRPEFGLAQAEVEAIRRLDQDALMPNPHGDGEISVRDARRMMEKEGRTVEALRNCMGLADAV